MARRYALGRAEEATHPNSMRTTLAVHLRFRRRRVVLHNISSVNRQVEWLQGDRVHGEHGYGTYRGHGSVGETTTPTSVLVVTALASALALFAAVAASINISSGHVNPAVTFGALLGGRISVVLAIYYWVAQLLGAILASLLLRLVANGMRPVGFFVASGVGDVHGLLLEIILTFGLVYVVHATAIDPKKEAWESLAPLAIGLNVGANSSNEPSESIRASPGRVEMEEPLDLLAWSLHWGGLAALVYEYMVIPTEPPLHSTTHQPLAPEDY